MLSRLRLFWKALFRRGRLESEMEAELRFHMDAYADDLVRSGVPRLEAERRARVEFGGVALTKEDCRQSLGLRLVDELRQDLRYAARSLRRSPGFTAAAVVSLALGIGANTVIFSFVDAVFLKPFAYKEPNKLVRLFLISERGTMQQMSGSIRDLQDLREASPVFADIAAQDLFESSMNFSGAMLEGAERVYAGRVTANYFRTLGVLPALGAGFSPDDNQPGRADVVLLSNRFWRERLGADNGIPGKIAVLNGRSYRIVGVLPPGPFDRKRSNVWIPMSFTPKYMSNAQWLTAIAKLKPGVSLAQANAAIRASRVAAEPYQRTWEYRDERALLLIAFGAVGFVLLIACVNVANLMLARASARRQEVAIRISIGAGRFRLVRQLLTESFLIAGAGAAAGAALAVAALPLAKRLVPEGARIFPVEATPTVDWRVLLFTAGAALCAGVLFGLAPSWQFSSPPAPGLAMRARRSRLQTALVTAETALAVVLASGAGLMTHSFARLMSLDPGYNPEQVLTWSVRLPSDRYPVAAKREYAQRFLERLRHIPAVEVAALGNSLPQPQFDGGVQCARYVPAMHWIVTPEYLPALRIPLLSGRWLLPSDTVGSAPVAVIDETVARACFGMENPVGRTIRLYVPRGSAPLEVVGVVKAVQERRDSRSKWAGLYLPLAQALERGLSGDPVFVVRTRDDPARIVPNVRAIAASLDKSQAVIDLKTMEEIVSDDVQAPRFRTALFGFFGVLALALAAAGVYGVTHYSVAQRTHEIGVRIALGARRIDIAALVLRQSLTLVLAGLALGMGAALALTRLLARMLFQIKPSDPATLATVAAVVAGAALIAAWFPARRAAGIEPVVTLKHE